MRIPVDRADKVLNVWSFRMNHHSFACRFRTLRLTFALPLAAALLVAGCDGSSTEAEHSEPARLDLVNRSSGELLAWTHGTGSSIHWDGGLPHIHAGDELALNTIFRDSDGNEIPLGGEYTVNAILTSGSPAGVVALDPHGDHVDIDALAEGEVQIIFQFWHGNHSEWDAPAIALEVEDHDDH
jgi:hypothetical protein